MTCSSCNQDFQSDKSGFIVCPHCGAVNVSSKPDEGVYVHASGVAVSPVQEARLKGLRLSNKLTSTVAITAVIIFLTGGLVAAHSMCTTKSHKTASTPIAKTKTVQSLPKPTTSTGSVNSQPPAAASVLPKSVAPTPKTLPTPQSNTPQPTLDGLMASINQQLSPYGVVATLTPPNNAYTYSTWSTLTSADVGNLQQFSAYLTQEFSKYPKDLVINSGLKTIGLIKNLQVSGGARAAAPAPSITGMLYDVNVMTNAGSAYAREVVSHEYWHYLDYKTHGSYTYDDPQWDACNPGGFVYGSGGATAYGTDSGYVPAFHPQADFITAYSEYAIAEDRAEMFGWLIYSPSSVKSLNDSGINCKINRLTVLVHQLSPSMTL